MVDQLASSLMTLDQQLHSSVFSETESSNVNRWLIWSTVRNSFMYQVHNAGSALLLVQNAGSIVNSIVHRVVRDSKLPDFQGI